MNWGSHAALGVRTPCIVVEVDLDYYDDDGDAVQAVNDDLTLCFRTPGTTEQAADDFTLTTKTRRWMTLTQRAIPELGAIPCLKTAKLQPEEVRVGKGLSYFGQVSIELQDFVDDDFREDPFYSHASRAAIDHEAGTYFGKLMARNPWWIGRKIRVIEGWATDGVWHSGDTIVHNFLIRDVQGPSGGTVKITAAGPLQLLNLNDAEAPRPSEGVLLADITNIATTATLADAVIAADYPSSGLIRIGDEIMSYTRSGVTLTMVRARQGTIADSHSAGDTVQWCLQYTDEPLMDIVLDLLTTYGGIDTTYLATDEWDSEQSVWLALYNLSGIVSQPTKILELVQSLLEASACLLWWDDTDGQLKARAVRPGVTNRGTWNDRFHLLGPAVVARDMTARVSRCDILIDLRSAERDPKDYASYRIRVVGAEEGNGATENKTSQVHVIASRWLSANQVGLAERASSQITTQLRDGRQTLQVEVAAKDAIASIGDLLNVSTKDIVDRNGEPETIRCMVVKREAMAVGSKYRYLLERFPFTGRFAFMTDIDCPDYDDATTEQKDPGGFMGNADGSDFGPQDPVYVMG
jgi:hypothetical protein